VSAVQRLAAFTLAVAAAFGAGLGLGAVAGPDRVDPTPTHEETDEHEAPRTGFGTGGFGGHDAEHTP
jgi:hypothetical protein